MNKDPNCVNKKLPLLTEIEKIKKKKISDK